ncbi:MAG: PIN domain-containing protein [Terriglobales bacterium]
MRAKVAFDTNALSAFAEGDAAIKPILRHAGEIAVPVIVLGEYLYAIAQSRYRQSYEEWLSESIRNLRILKVDEETPAFYAALRSELKRAGTPIPSSDIWIASLCRQHSFSLLSRDQHFEGVRELDRIGW